MLTSGALALIAADRVGWRATFLVLAALMLVGLAGTLAGPEPERVAPPPRSLREAVWGPLVEFFSRPGAAMLLLVVVLYKLGDAFAGSLTTAFLLRGVGFSLTDVGAVNKGLGVVAVIVGAVFGGVLLSRIGLYRGLMLFGVLQAVSNLGFMALAWSGKSYALMIAAVALENLAGGMGTAAFVALLMGLCNPRFTATQYALLSAVAALGRSYLGPVAGYLVESVGWAPFFLITAVAAMPGLVLLRAVRVRVHQLDRPVASEIH
jgi:PAT family beta-lactamase induction signal transducer AmpG